MGTIEVAVYVLKIGNKKHQNTTEDKKEKPS